MENAAKQISDKEYEMLRTAINNWIDRENKLWILAFTSIGVVFAFAFQQNNFQLLLGINISLIAIIGYLINIRTNYTYIGTYLAVVEKMGLNTTYNWENNNYKYKKEAAKKRSTVFSLSARMHKFSLYIVSSISLPVYIMLGVDFCEIGITNIFIISLICFTSIIVFILTRRYNSMNIIANECVEEWEQVLQQNGTIEKNDECTAKK